MKVTYIPAFLISGTIVALPACNAGGGEILAPVAGSVSVGGKPLTTGSVTFWPDASKGNASQHQPTGAIDARGRFELLVPPARKGAPRGWYKVVVTSLIDPMPGKPLKSHINMKYSSDSTTPLKVEVIENPEAGRYDINLTR